MTALLVMQAIVAQAGPIDALVRAYPEALSGFDGHDLIWRDGTRMPVGMGLPERTEAEALRGPSILEQMRWPYLRDTPPVNDAGRARNIAFFTKIYGDCRAGEVAPQLTRVIWLPRSMARSIQFTRVNGADRHLEAVSRALDDLPDSFHKYLTPLSGTYLCRNVADTGQTSMHAWGAAIDLNVAYSDYWLWQRGHGGAPEYRNRMPQEIVEIFERHGFIWGGRWVHFDTMHFEYRPELLGLEPADP